MTLPCAHLNVQSMYNSHKHPTAHPKHPADYLPKHQTSSPIHLTDNLSKYQIHPTDIPPKHPAPKHLTSSPIHTIDIPSNTQQTIYPNIRHMVQSTRRTFHPNTRQTIYLNTRHPAQSTQQTSHPNTQQTIYPNTRHPAQSTRQTFHPNTLQTIYRNTRHPAQSTRQTIHPNIQKTTIPHNQPNPPEHPKDDPTTHPAQPTRQTIPCTPNRCCNLETTHSVTFDRQSRKPPRHASVRLPGVESIQRQDDPNPLMVGKTNSINARRGRSTDADRVVRGKSR